MNDREAAPKAALCSAPHRIYHYHYQMSQWGWRPAQSLLIAFNAQVSASFLLYSFSSLSLLLFAAPFSSSLLLFQLFLEPTEVWKFFTQLFPEWSSAKGPLPPALSLSPSLLPLLWQSTPAWSWLHALAVQLPHRPSQPLHRLIPHSTGFWESSFISPTSILFALRLLRTGRSSLVF